MSVVGCTVARRAGVLAVDENNQSTLRCRKHSTTKRVQNRPARGSTPVESGRKISGAASTYTIHHHDSRPARDTGEM